jgi:outer membrane protein assembly factor BamB
VRSPVRVRLGALALALVSVGACDLFERAPLGTGSPRTDGGLELVLRTEPGDLFRFHRLTTDGVRVFSSSEYNTVVAMDMNSGAVAWRVAGGDAAVLGEATYADGRVYAASDSARAWDAATGALLWTTPLTGSAFQHIGHAGDGLFFIGTDTSVFALDGATGAIRWRTATGPGWAFSGRVRSVAGSGDALYVCASEPLAANGYRTRGHILALNPHTGAVKWRHTMFYETEFNFCLGEPTVANDLVIVGDAGANNIVAVDRATGDLRWRHTGSPEWVGPYASPEVVGDTLYSASNDKLILALDRTSGRMLWQAETDGSALHAIRCGRVVLASDYSLWVLDARSGRVLAKNLQLEYGSSDVVSSRILVKDGYAYAFGATRFYKWRCPT